MDEYTVHLTQNGKTRDISVYVANLSMQDSTDAYSVEVTFDVATNPLDRFMPDLGIEPKDGITLKNHDKTIWTGFVTTRTKSGQITCRDSGFYFKSEITCQFNNCKADAALNQVCRLAGVTYGWYGTWTTCISGEYVRQQASSIIDDILEQVSFVTNKRYIHRIIDGKLCVRQYDMTVSRYAVARPAGSPLQGADDFRKRFCSNHPGEATLPLRWLRQLPLSELAVRGHLAPQAVPVRQVYKIHNIPLYFF